MPDIVRIVVLGGGYGGVEAAKVLEREVGKRNDVQITLIDRNSSQTLMTELHEVVGGRVEPDSVQISYRKIFGARKVALVTDNIRTVDFPAREAISESARYPYDYIVISAGGEPEYYGLPGIKEHSFPLWSLEDALKLRRHMQDMYRRASAEPDAAKRAEILTFVVAGAGFTGVELAGELMDQRRVLCGHFHIDEGEVRIIVVEALDAIIPSLPLRLQQKSRRYLERRGVEFMLRTPIIGAQRDRVLLAGGKSIATRTFVWTCGIQGCEFAANLAVTKGKCSNRQCRFATTQGTCGVKDCTFSKDRYIEGKRGRLLVNEYMQSPDYTNVYVVGDVAWYLEGRRVMPQIVETAVQTAAVAAHNIAAEISGGEMKSFRSRYHGIMVSLGTYSGVAHVMGVSLSGIFAIAVKHMINVVHLFGVAGVNQVWEYLKHEFLEVKDSRSFIGGFAAYRVRSYWLLLLRLWLGFMWVVESTNKITQGWLDFTTGKSQTGWMFSPGVIQAGLKNAASVPLAVAAAAAPATDATSAASQAVGAAATSASTAAAAASTGATAAGTTAAATSAGVLAAGAATVDATSAASAAPAAAGASSAAGQAAAGTAASVGASAGAATPAAHGPWLDTTKNILDPNWGIVTWFRRWFMDGIFSHIPYNWFQVIIVLTELLVGLALFGGLFTWWAAAVSLGLCIIFTLSGMFAWNQLWFFFAAILMLGGAGRAFGLDSWVVPFFKGWWNGTRLAKRTRFYADEPTK
ncbi:MAG: FAD-dependent oxidoreductase [Spirochaetia bacterium]